MNIERVLIVGYGSIGQKHLTLIRDLHPNAVIKVLRHSNSSEVPDLSDGVLHEMNEVKSFEPTLAIICNPAPFHVRTAIDLAQMGIHLLVEKPLSNSMNDVENLIKLCQSNKVVLQVGYNLRHLKSLQRFKSLLDEGLVGDILSVDCVVGQYLPDWRPYTNYRVGVSARKEMGGGVLFELSHEIDYLRWIFGEVKWVFSVLSNTGLLDIESDVEDLAILTMGLQKDINEKLITCSLRMDCVRRDPVRSCVVIGSQGSLIWDGISEEIRFYSANKAGWDVLFSSRDVIDNSYANQWMSYLRCIEYGDTPFVTGFDGLQAVRVIEAARNSSISKSIVDLA